MRWLAIGIFAYILLGLEQGMAVAIAQPGQYGATPGLLLILLVFIGLSAPTPVVVWSSLALGVLYDLAHPVMVIDPQDAAEMAMQTGQYVSMVGPGAIGFLVGAFVLLRARGLVYRGSLVSIVLFTFITGVFAHLTIVFIFAMRGLPFLFFPGEQIVGWSWSGELVSRFISLLYTMGLSLPIGWVLLRSFGMFGFEPPKGHSRR